MRNCTVCGEKRPEDSSACPGCGATPPEEAVFIMTPGDLLGARILKTAVMRYRKTLLQFSDKASDISKQFGKDVENRTMKTAQELLDELRQLSRDAGVIEGLGVQEICKRFYDTPEAYRKLMKLEGLAHEVFALVNAVVEEADKKLAHSSNG